MSTNRYEPNPSRTPGTASIRRRLTVHDIREESASSVYVKNKASKQIGKPTQILIDHTHQGRTAVIEVPPTFIPVDLTLYMPKDQLLENPSFMSLVARGWVELVATDDAIRELKSPEAMAEQDRIRAQMERRYPELQGDGALDMRAINPEQAAQLQQTQMGDVKPEDIGVSAAVIEALQREDVAHAERVALIRNLSDVMTNGDRSWVRKNTSDEQILAAISQ